MPWACGLCWGVSFRCFGPSGPCPRWGGIPAQYPINVTWGAVGYSLLGRALTEEAPRFRPRTFAWMYLAGLAVTFGGTWGLSLLRGQLYLGFLQGNAPGVCLEAAGLYGWCVSRFSGGTGPRWSKTVSQASFCVYLVHLFFLEELVSRGFSAGAYSPVWAVPALTAAVFAVSFGVWLILRRIPVVNRWLI